MTLQKLVLLLTILSINLIQGCSTVVYDTSACADLGAGGAECNNLYTQNPKALTKEQWDQLRPGWICLPSQGWSDTQTSMNKLCIKYGCTYEQRTALEHMSELIRIAQTKNPMCKRIIE